MASIVTRACCAMPSIIGIVGLAFADPGSAIGKARSLPVTTVAAAAGPIAVAHRG